MVRMDNMDTNHIKKCLDAMTSTVLSRIKRVRFAYVVKKSRCKETFRIVYTAAGIVAYILYIFAPLALRNYEAFDSVDEVDESGEVPESQSS